MLSCIGRLTTACLLLLSSQVYAFKWHFRIGFHRYSDQYCTNPVEHRSWVKSGHCKSFDHEFTAFAYVFGKHFNWENHWDKYGNCTIRMWEQKHCTGQEIAHLSNANDLSQAADCCANDLPAKSVKATCIKDGVEVEEVDPGEDDPGQWQGC